MINKIAFFQGKFTGTIPSCVPGDSGDIYAGSVATSGTGSSWSNTTNATGDTTGTYATCNISAGDFSQYLELTNFGFEIPSEATIIGIEAKVLYLFSIFSDGFGSIETIRLIKDSSAVGQNKAVGQSFTSVAATTITLGNDSDLWETTWNPSDINASTFGIQIRGREEDGIDPTILNIDWVSIKVYYSC